MPKEYIEREVISEGIRKYYYKNPPNSSYQEGFDCGLDKAQRVILNAPVADVAPVRRGRWIEEDGIQICSECGEEHEWEDYRAPYCDTCGAKMAEKAVKEEACQNGGN